VKIYVDISYLHQNVNETNENQKLFWNSFYTKLTIFDNILGTGNRVVGIQEREKQNKKG